MAIQDIIYPALVVVFSLIYYFLALRQYAGKPARIKKWFHFIFLGYTFWGALTLALRLAPNRDIAVLLLRLATLSVIFSYYGWFRFNVPFVNQSTTNSLWFYLFHILTGANIVLAGLSNQIDVRSEGGYYFDNFTGDTFILLLLMAVWGGIWILRGLRSTNFFASFYDPDVRSRLLGIPVYISVGLLITAIFILNNVLTSSEERVTDSSGFIIFALVVITFLGYIYGIRPVSSVTVSQKVWHFMIINPHGVPYLKENLSRSEDLVNIGLFAAGITALRQIYRSQFTSSEQSIQSLALEDRVILVANQNNWMFCLVASNESIQTELLLDELKTNLLEIYDFPEDFNQTELDANDELYTKLANSVNNTVRFSGGDK